VSNVVLQRGRGFEAGFDTYDDEVPVAERNREIRERVAPQTTAAALAWLAEPRQQPFFLWVHYQDPHGPYAPPPDYRGRFHLAGRAERRPLAVLADNSGVGGIPAYQVLGDLRHPGVYEDRYIDEIFYADGSIGQLIEAADRAAGAPGAVVLLTGDHGESLGEGDQYFVHRATTPDVAHVPMILRAPGLAPQRYPDLVHHVDVLPTLLELARVPAPAETSGIALGPALRGGARLPERVVFTDIGEEVSAYTQTGFLQIRGVAAAWLQRAEASRALAPSATRYAWESGGAWQANGEQAVFPPAVDRYLRRAVPMHAAADPSNEDIERLRALGYLEAATL
jgi:arylsulfatase A-like enzyme